MAEIDLQKQTYMNNGVETDARTGTPVNTTGLTPTPDQLAARTAPSPATPTPSPSGTTPEATERYSRYTATEQEAATYLDTSTPEKSVEQLQAEKTTAAKAQIDALNSHYDSLLGEQRTINESRERGTNAISVLNGLGGSSEALGAANQTTQLNQRDNDKIQNERAVAIQGVLSKIRSDAVEEARQSRLDAKSSAESVLARRKDKLTASLEQIKSLSMAGTTADGLKATDAASYKHLADMAGGEEQLKAIFTLNRPVETVLDKRVEGGKYIIAYQNPIDGKVRMETVDLGIPNGYKHLADAGDRILFAPDNWNGDPNSLLTVNKGLSPDQAADNALANQRENRIAAGGGGDTPMGDNPQLYSGLSSKTATAVRSKVGAFKSEPAVQNFSTIQEGYNFAKSIKTNTTNPADDQALIYSLAKALDPGSVVREGEYATAQKYAQSWVAAYGKGVTQAVAGTGFLSEKARSNIKSVIESKYKASKNSYDALYKNYEGGVNNLTGRADGSKFLTDYSAPSGSTGSKVLVKEGKSFDASDLSPEEYREALADGYTEQ